MTFLGLRAVSLMDHIVLVALVVFATFFDLLAWGAVLGALLLGGSRKPWWSVLPLAAGSTICGLALMAAASPKAG
jgi:hypothetical protein